jgi:hypothetical protein
MASQITHIPYGKKVLDLFLSDQPVDEKKFFIGTLFPDIRYLGVIDREKSHFSNPTVEGLRNITSDFEKGMYAHALIDIEREKTLEHLGAYNFIEGNKVTTYAMKFIEDELAFDLVPDWSKYINYLDDILIEEEDLVTKEPAKKWHGLLQVYFSDKPTWNSVVTLASALQGFNTETLTLVKNEIEKIKQDTKAMEIIGKTYSELFSLP